MGFPVTATRGNEMGEITVDPQELLEELLGHQEGHELRVPQVLAEHLLLEAERQPPQEHHLLAETGEMPEFRWLVWAALARGKRRSLEFRPLPRQL